MRKLDSQSAAATEKCSRALLVWQNYGNPQLRRANEASGSGSGSMSKSGRSRSRNRGRSSSGIEGKNRSRRKSVRRIGSSLLE